jgi:hypothetical protein
MTRWAPCFLASVRRAWFVLVVLGVGTSVDATPNRISFAPNQLAAALWYHAGVNGSLINGHIEGGFSNFSLWQDLQRALAANQGAFGCGCAELHAISDQTLAALTSSGVETSVEDNTFTQCLDGAVLGNFTFYGQDASLFCSTFQYCPPGVLAASGLGWYQSANGTPFFPDEVVFDERMPNLVPMPQRLSQLWNATLGGWAQRKAAAFLDSCPEATIFNPGVGRITGLIGDYVDFVKVARRRFGARAPKFAVHWNVIAWWEWSDEACLDALQVAQPDLAQFQHDVLYLTQPCHRDTDHLIELVTAMCGNGTCPSAVYHDVDYTYNTAYALEVLRRNKRALSDLNVTFGLDIVDLCTSQLDCEVVVGPSGSDLVLQKAVAGPPPAVDVFVTPNVNVEPNLLQERSLLTLVQFLIDQSIIDSNTALRVQSWTVRPIEQGELVDERRNGSLAHTANAILGQLAEVSGGVSVDHRLRI